MNKKHLQEFADKLEKMRLEGQASLAELKDSESTLEENKTVGDDVDQSTTNSEITRIKNLKRQVEVKLVQIDSAQKRLLGGLFGVCIDCEEDIPKTRLLANPLSIRCLECQEDQEQADKENKMKSKRQSSYDNPFEE